MVMDDSVWIYNWIPNMHSGLSDIEIWPISRFEPVSENLSSCQVWDCPTYILEPKFQNPVVKIPKLDPNSQREVDMGFIKMN